MLFAAFTRPLFGSDWQIGKSRFGTRWGLLYLSTSKLKKNHIMAYRKSCLALLWCKTEITPQTNEKSWFENGVISYVVAGIRIGWNQHGAKLSTLHSSLKRLGFCLWLLPWLYFTFVFVGNLPWILSNCSYHFYGIYVGIWYVNIRFIYILPLSVWMC